MIADLSLLAVYGLIVAAFAVRFARERHPAALFIAGLPVGWLLFAVLDLVRWLSVPAVVRWSGVAFGVALLVFVFRGTPPAAEPAGEE